MLLKAANPTTPCRAFIGFGVSQSSAACGSENTIPTVLVNRLQRRFGLSELHALTVLRLASLGPKEGRD